MVSFWIKKIFAEKEGVLKTEYEFVNGMNIIQSEGTKRGKTTLIGIIDYCLNADSSVFSWDLSKKYDFVGMIISINDTDFFIKRKLNEETGKINIFCGDDFQTVIDEDITSFFTKYMGILFSRVAWGDSSSEISIRDYMRLFFIRQLDTQNPIGNSFGFNKVVQAGKIVFGLEEKGKLEVKKNDNETKISEKTSYLQKLEKDLGDLSYFSDDKLNQKKEELNVITSKINEFEDKISDGKEKKLPLGDKISLLERKIRNLSGINESLLERKQDLELLKIDLEKEKKVIRQTEVATNILSNFPDESCPECNQKLNSGEQLYCKICGKKIEDQLEIISSFYVFNQNTKKDIAREEILLDKEIALVSEEISKLMREHALVYTQLKNIERSSILRFTQEVKEMMNERDDIINEISEISIKNSYLKKINEYKTEIQKIAKDSEDIQTSIDALVINLEVFQKHQQYTTNFLKILNTSYQDVAWVDENIFPRIDNKAFIRSTGGSNSVRILLGVLSSLFLLSVESKIKLPSIFIIDSLRKHEIELEDLDKIGLEWGKILSVGGQMILTGVEFPQSLINFAKESGKFFFIHQDEYTL